MTLGFSPLGFSPLGFSTAFGGAGTGRGASTRYTSEVWPAMTLTCRTEPGMIHAHPILPFLQRLADAPVVHRDQGRHDVVLGRRDLDGRVEDRLSRARFLDDAHEIAVRLERAESDHRSQHASDG